MFKIGDKIYNLHEVSKIYVTKTVDPQFLIKLRELADTLEPIKPNEIELCNKIKTITNVIDDINIILLFTTWYLRSIESNKYIIKQCHEVITSLSVKNWDHILKSQDLGIAYIEIRSLIKEGYIFKDDKLNEIESLFSLIKESINSKEKVETYLNDIGAIIQTL